VVEEVENFGAQLQADALAERRVFEDGEVEVLVAGAAQRVAAEAARRCRRPRGRACREL
jgi:hypothetical protein